MKTIATAIAAIALTMGAATQAEAREYRGERYSPSVYISGRASCGTPIYTERYFVRLNRHGSPMWGYRTLPISYHSRQYGSSGRGYDRGYGRDACRDDRDRAWREAQRESDRRHRDYIRSIYR